MRLVGGETNSVTGHWVLGFGAPRLPVLLRLLAGPRLGLFLYTPAAALAVIGAVLWWRRHRHRAELVLATAVCAV